MGVFVCARVCVYVDKAPARYSQEVASFTKVSWLANITILFLYNFVFR